MSDANAIPNFDTPRTLGSYALNSVQNVDLFTLCDGLPEASVDMILCDLPYGTTACAWDTVIPFEPMWARFKRVIKPRGAIVLTASQPFTSALVMSNPKMFKYEGVWEKSNGGGFLNANCRPLPRHENYLVFYEQEGVYNPQMSEGKPYQKARGETHAQINNGGTTGIVGFVTVNTGERYPTSVVYFPSETGLHSTQKPVALFEYLIRTYTIEGDVVLDPCVGSGTTALAARNCKRAFIVGDTDAGYCAIANDRLRLPFAPRMVKAANDVSDLPLFQERNS